jgi:hypothetical protein
MIKAKGDTNWLDFYPGGVPAGIVFDGQVKDACELADMRPGDEDDLRSGVGAEYAFIGLIAHFEGFCKNHTASIINICPQLIRSLADRGRDIKLRPVDILDYAENLSTQFGSLVIEKIDFGTANTINGFYQDLLGITPLSKRESSRFHALLEDRHLIVHHGNILAPSYASERFIRREQGRSRIFVDSLEVTPDTVRAAGKFLHDLSVKLRIGSQQALTAFVKKNNLRLQKSNSKAAKSLGDIVPDEN